MRDNSKRFADRRDGNRDVPGSDEISEPHINPPQFGPGDEPNIPLPPRAQVTIDDDTDDHPTVTACMDCLEWFPTARDSWERCPMCGSGLVDVAPAGDSA